MGRRAGETRVTGHSGSPFFIGDKLEATGGFEPPNRGFADPRLNHLATSPRYAISF